MPQDQRPISPSSEWSAGDYQSFSSGAARVCRALFVESEAHETGVRSTVYCRIALSRSTQHTKLVSLNPLSHLLHHSTYALPLGPESLSSSSTECLRAARLLGLSGSSSGASSRNGSATSSPQPKRHFSSIRLVQEDKDISLVLGGGDSTPSRSLSPTALGSPSPNGAPLARVSSNTSSRSGQMDVKEEKLEWILVMRLESSFGGLQSPRFANGVTIPLPTCLRNTLSFTLPSESSSSADLTPQWDLVVKPSLLSSTTSMPPGEDGPATITGPFASTSALCIRWTPRGSHPLVLPRSKLDVVWGIGENGWGRVTVKGEAEIDYAGLRDQAWVELKVHHGASSSSSEGRGAFEVLSIEGEGVMTWEVAGQEDDRKPPSRRPTARLAREPSGDHSTPTPRPRPRNSTALTESRPPSFTNLFDQAPPEAPQLDPSLLTKMAEPSLLRQAAPFEGDTSMDMTFEAVSSDEEDDEGLTRADRDLVNVGRRSSTVKWKGGSATSSPEAPEADADWPREPEHFSTSTTIRVQLNLASLLVAEKVPSPTFTFILKADFPTVTLRSLSSSYSSTSTEPHSFRLALPTFSLPAAVHEDSVVTVSAGTGGSVELLATDPMMQDPADGSGDADSPLPATGGRARWRTERSSLDESSGRRSRQSSELVEVEVSLPPSRPTSLVQLDDLDSDDSPSASPSYRAIRRPRSTRYLQRGQTPSFQSLRSKSSAHSLGLNLASAPLSLAHHRPPTTLGLVKLRITPVPPGVPEQPWRLFTHLTFPRPFVGTFDLPLKDEQEVAVCDSWNERGESTLVESETLEARVDGEDRTMRIETGLSRKSSPVVARKEEAQMDGEQEGEGLNEMLYCVSTTAKDGSVELGDVLPKLGMKVSSMEVEVLPVAGYDLLTDKQSFDSATPAQDGISTRFTRFQIPASETSRLSVTLQPSNSAPNTPPLPSVESTFVKTPSPPALPPREPTPPRQPTPPPREPTPPPLDAVAEQVVEPGVDLVVDEPVVAEPQVGEPVAQEEQASAEPTHSTLFPPLASPALPSLPPTPAVELASQADWSPSIKPTPSESSESSPPPSPPLEAIEPPIDQPSPPTPSPPSPEEDLTPPPPTEAVAEAAQHDEAVEEVKTPPFTPAALPLSPSPVVPRSLLSSILRLLPLLFFLLAVAFSHFATDQLRQLSPLNILGDKGPWPSFDAAGELVLVQTPKEVSVEVATEVQISTAVEALTVAETTAAPTSEPVVSLSLPLPTVEATITVHPSTPPPPPISEPSPFLPSQPKPTYVDDLRPPIAVESEPAGLEEAGFPSVMAEIIASWKSLGEDVKGWVTWLVGLVGIVVIS